MSEKNTLLRFARSWRCRHIAIWLFVVWVTIGSTLLTHTATADSDMTAGQSKMLAMLYQRVEENPGHSESWRSLGRLQLSLDDTDAAMDSFLHAVETDGFNAAAHFDLGQLLLTLERDEQAQSHFNRVFEIASTSAYATRLRDQGIVNLSNATASLETPRIMPIRSDDGVWGMIESNENFLSEIPFSDGIPLHPISYEIQTFDGSDDFKQRFDQLESDVQQPQNRLRIFLETGVLYNSNVTLTPISRDLAQGESASFQSFTNPDLDYKIIQKNTLRAGPMFRGYFTLNESNFQDFNLSSYQPGMFVERDFRLGSHESIGRFEYLYSTDFFDGDRIGNRHSATVSLTSIRPDLDAIYTYFTLASSDFTDDGEIPSQSSLDGVTITAGSTRFFQTGWKSLPNHSLGLDFESADTEGDDFRYHSLNLHGSTNWLFFEGWKFSPTWGIGFRDYPDFMGLIDRQEFFWRLHGRVQYTLNEMWAISAVAGHDRFASDNQDFDTERTEGGLVLTFTR